MSIRTGRHTLFPLLVGSFFALSLPFESCASPLSLGSGNLKIEVEPGSHWLHDYPLFLGLKKKNPPQIALWVETPGGRYIGALYVSGKSAKQSWLGSKDIRRPEALPVWSHHRGIADKDGLYMPTKDMPETDAISGATPEKGLTLAFTPALRQFIILVEVNHSVDFNDAYPKSAAKGSPSYTGGDDGSGQPSIVYAATVDFDSETIDFPFLLLGHGSQDGRDGNIAADNSTLTSALDIVKSIKMSQTGR
jgi:hypothetical protein